MDRWAWGQIDPLASRSRVLARRRAVVRRSRAHAGPALVERCGARDASPTGGSGGCSAALSAAPAASCARGWMAREGVPLNVIRRHLGHANLGITSVYLQGIDNSEIIDTVTRPSGADTAGQRGPASLVPAGLWATDSLRHGGHAAARDA